MDERNEEVVFKNCTHFFNWKSEMNNTHINYAKDLDTLMLMYKLIEYRNNYLKALGSLW